MNHKKKLKRRDLWGYAFGEGASSITMNGISNFGMLFYTQIMGMSPELAGMALSIATVWDAVTDPLMGTISDRTATRFGRRHPYMLVGGVFLALMFLALWFVPESFRGEKALFGYLLGVNVLLKTAFTVFVVPFTALGFEMCKRDDDRARLQGVRFGFNMIINILFGGLGWILFFGDKVAADGTRIDGTKVHENFLNMGGVLAAAAVVLIVACVCATYKFAEKGLVRESGSVADYFQAFIHDLKDVYSDKLVWLVFGFFGLAQFAMLVVSQVQMFTYVEYMKFSDFEKTFVHTGGMVGFMLGSLLLGSLVKRLDKKKTGYLAMLINSFGCLALLVIFSGGLMAPQSVPLFEDPKGAPFHLSCIVFGLLQMLWWGGCGILAPTATSMIADLSQVKRLQSGEVTEGRYAAGFSFFIKAAVALGLFVTGYILKSVGYVSGAESQTVETVNKLALITFSVGPILMVLSFFILRKYPIDRTYMESLQGNQDS